MHRQLATLPRVRFFALILRSIRNCSGMRCRPDLGTMARLSRQFNVPPVVALAADASIPRFGMVPEKSLPTAGLRLATYPTFDHQATVDRSPAAAPRYPFGRLVQHAAEVRADMFRSGFATA